VRRTWEDLVREKGCRLKRGGGGSGASQKRGGAEMGYDQVREIVMRR